MTERKWTDDSGCSFINECHRQTVKNVPNNCNTLIQITENMREISSNTALTKDLNKRTEDGSFKT